MRKYREKRTFKDLETGNIHVIYIYRSGLAEFNRKYYMSYKSARARLTKISSGNLARIKEDEKSGKK